jgi:uncharacterized protein YbaP (TraB family)
MNRLPPLLRRCAAILAAAPFLLLLLVTGLPIGGQPAVAEEVPFGKGILWRVQPKDAAPDAAPNHLFGTMHITDERVTTLAPPVRAAFDGAKSATFEIIMTDEARQAMGQAMVLRDGRTLDAILGPENFAEVAEAGRRYGFDPTHLRFFKPWALATIFSIPQAEMARNAGGNLPLDQALQVEAAMQGKPVHALETPEEQLALFNDMPEDNQIAMLNSAIEQNGMIETLFEEMTRQYLDRDTGGIYSRMQAQRDAQPELMELFLRRFNDERNQIMADRMAGRLAEGGAFIAVGALHLPGEHGLLSLLSQRGYSVERVY